MYKKIEDPCFNIPLEGQILLEANAGCGKTYMLTNLFLRFLIEKGLSVSQILSLTYTESATQELKERIRDRIRFAHRVFSGKTEDPIISTFMDRVDVAEVKDRLEEALRELDKASIHTIHGFCYRVLRELAFYSGLPFELEPITDETHYRKELLEDFWRNSVCTEDEILVRLLVKSGGIKLLWRVLNLTFARLDPKILTIGMSIDYGEKIEEFREKFRIFLDLLDKHMSDLEKLLEYLKEMNKRSFSKEKVDEILKAFQLAKKIGVPDPFIFLNYRSQIRKISEAGSHPLFSIVGELLSLSEEIEELFRYRVQQMESWLIESSSSILREKKLKEGRIYFDDMLILLYESLKGEGGARLSEKIREDYKVALVDEFQDTDPIQYSILKSIYYPNGTIVFIGDPKQSIYGFRGADIFSYIKAVSEVKERYLLIQNWRSEKGILSAVNSLFSLKRTPFLMDEIGYEPSQSAEERSSVPLLLDGSREEGIKIFLIKNGGKKGLSKYEAGRYISKVMAGKIAQLLKLSEDGKAVLGDRPLRPGDIAVLVRKNSQARLFKEALSSLNIPSVIYSTEDLFQTQEAEELLWILHAVFEPHSRYSILRALGSEIMGFRAEEINSIIEDEVRWEEEILRFEKYHMLLNRDGLMRMFRTLMKEMGTLERLLSLPDGKRRITDLFQLLEMVFENSIQRGLRGKEILRWLQDRIKGGQIGEEEQEIRLETDEEAVKVITIHRSKGLEFPIVFIPFVWDQPLREREGPIIVRGKEETIIDLGSLEIDSNKNSERVQTLSEELRLLYVAITRAKNLCYLAWGRISGVESSPFTYLLKDKEEPSFNQPERALKKLIQSSNGSIELIPDKEIERLSGVKPIEEEKAEELEFSNFKGKIQNAWHINSFSSLSGRRAKQDERDRDEDVLVSELPEEEEVSIFTFPRGAECGIMIHEIMEELNFQAEKGEVEGLVRDKIQRYGYEGKWVSPLVETICSTLEIPLMFLKDRFCLRDIPPQNRINEMEFIYPIRKIKKEDFIELLGVETDSLEGKRLTFSPTYGFMKGFIDLVFEYNGRFYLVDWKTNYLGPERSYYEERYLKKEMSQSLYHLQYHIYWLSLYLFLRSRLPEFDYETHMGCIYYIFLRGVGREDPLKYGIFRARPKKELIYKLCKRIVGY